MTLREHRLRRGLTLEATAYIAGVHESTVSRVENAKVEPDPETVVKLARGYGVSVKRFRELMASTVTAMRARRPTPTVDEVEAGAA